MSHQDLKPQSFNFSGGGGGGGPKKVSETGANRTLQAGGSVDVTRKMGGGNAHSNLGKQAKTLDDDTESTKHKTVSMDVRLNIQRGRQAKEWNQQQLAAAISERKEVVAEYENGKAIPNEQVLVRMEKALGMYLRGVNAGQPFAAKPKPKGKK